MAGGIVIAIVGDIITSVVGVVVQRIEYAPKVSTDPVCFFVLIESKGVKTVSSRFLPLPFFCTHKSSQDNEHCRLRVVWRLDASSGRDCLRENETREQLVWEVRME